MRDTMNETEPNTQEKSPLQALLDASDKIEAHIHERFAARENAGSSNRVDATEEYKALLNTYVKLNITRIISNSKGRSGNFRPQSGKPSDQPGPILITEKQRGFLQNLAKKQHKELIDLVPLLKTKPLDQFTMLEASDAIEALQKMPAPARQQQVSP
jgi:hypothetical protein